MIGIRTIKPHDLPFLQGLFKQLGYPTEQSTLQKQIDLFLNQEGYGIVVAEIDQRIVGIVAWSKSIPLVVPKTRFHIEALIVDNAYRKKGVGKKLMQHVEEVAQQYKPCIIDLTSGLRRQAEGTHDFYRALGYDNQGYMAKVYLRKEINE